MSHCVSRLGSTDTMRFFPKAFGSSHPLQRLSLPISQAINR